MIVKNSLISILREMGTNLDMYKMNEWEIYDEILRRIALTRDKNKRMLSEIKRLQQTVDSLRQLDMLEIVKQRLLDNPGRR